jgi:hypothetical protein
MKSVSYFHFLWMMLVGFVLCGCEETADQDIQGVKPGGGTATVPRPIPKDGNGVVVDGCVVAEILDYSQADVSMVASYLTSSKASFSFRADNAFAIYVTVSQKDVTKARLVLSQLTDTMVNLRVLQEAN